MLESLKKHQVGELDRVEVRNIFLGEYFLPKVLFICLPRLFHKCIIMLHECQKKPQPWHLRRPLSLHNAWLSGWCWLMYKIISIGWITVLSSPYFCLNIPHSQIKYVERDFSFQSHGRLTAVTIIPLSLMISRNSKQCTGALWILPGSSLSLQQLEEAHQRGKMAHE